MYVVDASVFVARFTIGDAHYAHTVAWMRSLDRTPLYAPSILLPEFAGALSRRLSPGYAARALGLLPRMLHLEFVDIDVAAAETAAQIAIALGMRGADSTYVAVAAAMRAPLVTWDRDQMTRAARFVAVSSPLDAMRRGPGG